MNCLIVERGDVANHNIINRLKIKFEDTPFSYKSKNDGIAIISRKDDFICGHIHYIMDRHYIKITKWSFFSQLDSILGYVTFLNKIMETKNTHILMFSEDIWNNPYNQWVFKITNTWSEDNCVEIDSLFDPFVNQIIDFVKKPEQSTIGTQTDPVAETKSLAVQTTPTTSSAQGGFASIATKTTPAFAPQKTPSNTSVFAPPNTSTFAPPKTTPTTPAFAPQKTPAFAPPKTTSTTPTTPTFAPVPKTPKTTPNTSVFAPPKKTETTTQTSAFASKPAPFSVPSFNTLGSFTFGK